MTRTLLYVLATLLLAGLVHADDPVKAKKTPSTPGGDKLLSGMSIVGNDEAPKSLVIVPWKGSHLGDALDLGKLHDDGRQPVDKEVFLRELTYYQIRAKAD